MKFVPITPYHLHWHAIITEVLSGLWYWYKEVWQVSLVLFILCMIPLWFGRKWWSE